MQNPGVERLRGHLRRHNRRVLFLTLFSLLLAAALWAILYFIAWWLFLFAGTAMHSVDFAPERGALVRGFVATGLLLCFCAWLARRARPNQAPRDRKGLAEHLLDFLLAVPRLTLSIFGTAGAAARLSDTELEHAWLLLRRMNEENHPVPVQRLPVEIPDSAMRDHIVMALQLSGVIEIRPSAKGPVLAFQNQEARHLGQDRVRLRF
jgi:hypothetical protein